MLPFFPLWSLGVSIIKVVLDSVAPMIRAAGASCYFLIIFSLQARHHLSISFICCDDSYTHQHRVHADRQRMNLGITDNSLHPIMPTRRPSRWPRPLAINPQTLPHKQTFIILHDRGSNATDFGTALLFKRFDRSQDASNTDHQSQYQRQDFTAQATATLHTAFPHAKFVFPTAPMLRAATFTESVINQWFDTHWPLTSSDASEVNERNSLDEETRKWRSELPIPGLRDTVRYIHELIKAEIEILDGDAGSVIIGGLSQGCAASLISALLWEGEPLGGWFGLSGWLPFAEEVMEGAQQDDEDENEASTPLEKGIALLREKLDIPASSQTDDDTKQSSLNSMPLFLAHGSEDKAVHITLGRQMVDCLKSLGWSNHNLQWKEYRGLAHTYSENMLSDMVEFLTERLVCY